jgi:hypothetical protein
MFFPQKTPRQVSRQLSQSRGWFASSAAPRVTLSRHGTALDAALSVVNGRAKVAVLGAASVPWREGGEILRIFLGFSGKIRGTYRNVLEFWEIIRGLYWDYDSMGL